MKMNLEKKYRILIKKTKGIIMKETGIIFNTEMVRAIDNGSKIMTRRPVNISFQDFDIVSKLTNKGFLFSFARETQGDFLKCPYGKIGDRIYVRETFFETPHGYAIYKAESHVSWKFKWKPSIHMPKEYARIWLEITDIRVERIQDISERDCQAEGISDGVDYTKGITYKILFKKLWDSIYQVRGLYYPHPTLRKFHLI